MFSGGFGLDGAAFNVQNSFRNWIACSFGICCLLVKDSFVKGQKLEQSTLDERCSSPRTCCGGKIGLSVSTWLYPISATCLANDVKLDTVNMLACLCWWLMRPEFIIYLDIPGMLCTSITTALFLSTNSALILSD